MKIKIGNFARLGQVTVQALRHYDELGLLKPSEVDALSGYRYYALEQLPRLHRILALKDLGFSLEQIAPLLEESLPPAELQGMLRLKRYELRQQLEESLDRLERLDARLQLLEQEGHDSDYEVVIKRVAPLRVISVRRAIPSYWEEGPLWGELYKCMQQAGLKASGPYLSLYHTGEPEIDVEVCAPVSENMNETPGLTVQDLPEINSMASTIHRGSFMGLAGAFAALLKWIDANDYQTVGPDRAIYLRLPEQGKSRQDPDAVTEMQVPVERK